MEQEIINILGNVSKWGAIAIAAYFVLRPLVDLFVDWARERMGGDENEDSYGKRLDNIEKKHKKMETNDLHHIEADISEIKRTLLDYGKKQNSLEGRIIRLETKIFNGMKK